MRRRISVEPLDGRWVVRFDRGREQMIFSTGAPAERAAKRIAQQLAEAGHATEILIYLRGGVLASRFACAPARPIPYLETAPREAVPSEADAFAAPRRAPAAA